MSTFVTGRLSILSGHAAAAPAPLGRGRRGPRRAMSLIEVMVSLAICSSLLVAVAAAFNASSAAININDRFFRATQAGRVSMAQMLAAVRKCQEVQVGDTYDGSSLSVSSDKLNFRAVDGKYYYYRYNTDGTLTITDVAAGATRVLAHNIRKEGTLPLFIADMEPDPATHVMQPSRVTVRFAVSVDDSIIHLSNSSVPRRSAVY